MQLLLRHTIVPLYLCLKRALLKLTSRASRPIGRLLRPLVLGLTIVGTARPACVGHLHAARLQLYTPSCPLIYSFTSTLTLHHQWIFQELLALCTWPRATTLPIVYMYSFQCQLGNHSARSLETKSTTHLSCTYTHLCVHRVDGNNIINLPHTLDVGVH